MSVKKISSRSAGQRNFLFSIVTLAILIIGVSTAVSLFNYAQDIRGSAKELDRSARMANDAIALNNHDDDLATIYTKQLYASLGLVVQDASDTTFLANVKSVQDNNCFEVVKSLVSTPEFKLRTENYSNLQYAQMMYRTVLSRNLYPDDSSNSLVKELDSGNINRNSLLTKLYSASDAQQICKDRLILTD